MCVGVRISKCVSFEVKMKFFGLLCSLDCCKNGCLFGARCVVVVVFGECVLHRNGGGGVDEKNNE